MQRCYRNAQGSRNTFDFDPELGLFRLGGVLPLGAVFPFDFGFVPSPLGEDGDPLDVLTLMDEPAFTGCLVAARLIGVIEAEQTEGGETVRSDCLIAVEANSRNQHELHALEQLSASRVELIEHFFVSYNAGKGKRFTYLDCSGPERTKYLVEAATHANSGKHT